jgi:hypothetical protein
MKQFLSIPSRWPDTRLASAVHLAFALHSVLNKLNIPL